MPDTLEVFGVEYTNVAGFKAKDDNGQTKIYVRPQGSLSITSNNTYDVTGYASAIVNVSGGGPTLQTKTKSYTPTETAQSETITADTGYDGLSSVEVSVGAISSTYVGSDIDRRNSTDVTGSGREITVPSGYYATSVSHMVTAGTATTPARTITANPSISVDSSTGLITATASASSSITPSVVAGYISSGTAGTVTVSGSNTSQLTTKAAATITPGTTNQTIASGTYLTGTQTIAGDSNLTAANIKTGVQIFNVTGTYTSDANAAAADIVSGQTAYVNGSKITGSLVVQHYYTGSSTPSSSLGNNGDIYLKVT